MSGLAPAAVAVVAALTVSVWASAAGAHVAVETVRVDGVDVDIFTPALASGEAIVGDVLVLPGWDSTRTDWCSKDRGLCDEAQRRHMRLVMPEVAKSVYADAIYAETSAQFRGQLTRAHLVDVIGHLQRERGLLSDAAHTFVIGRSTGGRGAVLLALDHPEWFRAAASLSGDFDQTAMPGDGLMEGAYGPYAKFPERFTGRDNPQRRAAELRVPVYLGHGAKDAVVNPEQTRAFFRAVDAAHPGLAVLHIDEAGAHDHKYWRRELAPVFDFFAHAPDNVAGAAIPLTTTGQDRTPRAP